MKEKELQGLKEILKEAILDNEIINVNQTLTPITKMRVGSLKAWVEGKGQHLSNQRGIDIINHLEKRLLDTLHSIQQFKKENDLPLNIQDNNYLELKEKYEKLLEDSERDKKIIKKLIG